MTLQELIDDSRRIRDERRAAEDQRKSDDDARYRALFDQVMNAAFARISRTVPAPLHPFFAYALDDPSEADLRRYPGGFDPVDFKITGAPGLAEIFFTTTGKISVNGEAMSDWIEAVARASDPPGVEVKPDDNRFAGAQTNI
jgi:hypothetical protein